MEKLPKTIIIRITQEQYEYLMQWVKDTSRTISEVIRDMIDNNSKGE
jgi:predicted DNA-binding protein